jgi:hypothetical protein
MHIDIYAVLPFWKDAYGCFVQNIFPFSTDSVYFSIVMLISMFKHFYSGSKRSVEENTRKARSEQVAPRSGRGI